MLNKNQDRINVNINKWEEENGRKAVRGDNYEWRRFDGVNWSNRCRKNGGMNAAASGSSSSGVACNNW